MRMSKDTSRAHFLFRSFSNAAFLLSVPLFLGCGGETSGNDYLALGASDATGIGAEPLSEGYVFEIERGLTDLGEDVVLENLGIPGATADEIEDVALQLANILDTPELVTLWVGSNDVVRGRTVEEFEGDLQGIFSKINDIKSNATVVFVATVPDLTALPRFVDEPKAEVTTARIQAFNAAIVRQAQSAGATVLDFYAEPIESFQISDDGFHPNNAGHKRIGEVFLAAIKPTLPLGD
ncbi:MAG: SGNH/GDSL hydrolase family protein [Deltaproteobacteria bacterium]|nr:SGNH/GDSL hydrolase family protein [Deltaproteobacteria bacterium]